MSSVRLGLRENGVQVSNLLLIVVFIGAVVGVERCVLPLLAESECGLVSATATVSFLVTFGIAMALANFLAGDLGQPRGPAPHSPDRLGVWYPGSSVAHMGAVVELDRIRQFFCSASTRALPGPRHRS